MFECEVCGRQTDKVIKRQIEGTTVSVCPACARYGSSVSLFAMKKREARQRRRHVQARRRKLHAVKDLYERYEVVENYHLIIRRRREELGMKQKDFAKRLGIKESMLQKMEAGKFIPDIPTCMKIEAILGVKILREAVDEEVLARFEGRAEVEPTIGEVLEIKRRKAGK